MRYASITDRLGGLGSDKWAVHFRAKALIRANVDIIALTIGEPDVPPPPALIDAASNAMRTGRTGYSSGRGEPAVLDALAAKYSKRSGRSIGQDQVLYFPGTQSALYAVMMGLAEAGDDVLVGDPLYATYDSVIAASGARRVSVPLRADKGFHMQADDLARAVTPASRVLLLNSPHNPTGAVLSAAEIAAIGEVCRRHNLWIVSDEVYEALCIGGTFASPFDNPDLAERTVVVSSLSKSHAVPGFRSGWCVGPAEFTHRILPLAEAMLFGAQPFIADMAALALSREFPETEHMRQTYARRARIFCTELNQSPDLGCMMPEGGMFTMLKVGDLGVTGEQFALRLLEEHRVAVMPGGAFGKEAEGFCRMSLTVPDDRILEACGHIRQLADKIRHETRARKEIPA